MTTTKLWPAALLLAAACACPADAQQIIWVAPALQRPLGVAPDACGPGFYWSNEYGVFYGPCYCLQPPFPPESGVTPDMFLNGCNPKALPQLGDKGNGHGQPHPGFAHGPK